MYLIYLCVYIYISIYILFWSILIAIGFPILLMGSLHSDLAKFCLYHLESMSQKFENELIHRSKHPFIVKSCFYHWKALLKSSNFMAGVTVTGFQTLSVVARRQSTCQLSCILLTMPQSSPHLWNLSSRSKPHCCCLPIIRAELICAA